MPEYKIVTKLIGKNLLPKQRQEDTIEFEEIDQYKSLSEIERELESLKKKGYFNFKVYPDKGRYTLIAMYDEDKSHRDTRIYQNGIYGVNLLKKSKNVKMSNVYTSKTEADKAAKEKKSKVFMIGENAQGKALYYVGTEAGAKSARKKVRSYPTTAKKKTSELAGTSSDRYEVLKIYRKSGRRVVLASGLTKEQAQRKVSLYPDSQTSMVVFFKTRGAK